MRNKTPHSFAFFILLTALAIGGCGDDDRMFSDTNTSADGGDGDDGGEGERDTGGIDTNPVECVPMGDEGSVMTCGDGVDNDCDGKFDCADVDCSGVGDCPVCGEVETRLGQPLSLPDGVGGTPCQTNADCEGDQRCYETASSGRQCRVPYVSTLNFTGFEEGLRVENPSDVLSVCVEMEHSWVRDLQMEVEAPDGRIFLLQEFGGTGGNELYLGQANDCDDSDTPEPGTGALYCWTASATNGTMFDSSNTREVADCRNSTSTQLVPGEYATSDPWESLVGAPLNGEWSLAVADLWGVDNGYIFSWSISFSPETIADCSVPLM